MVLCKILDQYLSSNQTWTKSIIGLGNNEVLKSLMQNFNTNANANTNTRGSTIAFPEPCSGELKMIIHYWNKYANYLDPLCVDVHKKRHIF